MSTHINYAVLREIENDLASGVMDVARDGGWLCLECQKITVLDCDGPQSRCGICGSVRVKVLPPIPAEESRAAVSVVDKSQKGSRLVPVNEGHARFEALKASL